MTPVLLINAKLSEKMMMIQLMYFSALQSNCYFLRLQLWLQVKGDRILPVGFQPIVNVNADIISDALFLLLPFISNFLCEG